MHQIQADTRTAVRVHHPVCLLDGLLFLRSVMDEGGEGASTSLRHQSSPSSQIHARTAPWTLMVPIGMRRVRRYDGADILRKLSPMRAIKALLNAHPSQRIQCVHQ